MRARTHTHNDNKQPNNYTKEKTTYNQSRVCFLLLLLCHRCSSSNSSSAGDGSGGENWENLKNHNDVFILRMVIGKCHKCLERNLVYFVLTQFFSRNTSNEPLPALWFWILKKELQTIPVQKIAVEQNQKIFTSYHFKYFLIVQICTAACHWITPRFFLSLSKPIEVNFALVINALEPYRGHGCCVCVSFVCFLLLRNNSFDIKKRVVFKLCEL